VLGRGNGRDERNGQESEKYINEDIVVHLISYTLSFLPVSIAVK
jgi:hypothetical protein